MENQSCKYKKKFKHVKTENSLLNIIFNMKVHLNKNCFNLTIQLIKQPRTIKKFSVWK